MRKNTFGYEYVVGRKKHIWTLTMFNVFLLIINLYTNMREPLTLRYHTDHTHQGLETNRISRDTAIQCNNNNASFIFNGAVITEVTKLQRNRRRQRRLQIFQKNFKFEAWKIDVKYGMFHVTWTTFKFNRNQLGTVSAYVMISMPLSNQRAH